MTDREEKRTSIMAAARLLQEELKDELIRIDTIIVEQDKVILGQGKLEEDYREIFEICIDDKAVDEFFEKYCSDVDGEDDDDSDEDEKEEWGKRIVKFEPNLDFVLCTEGGDGYEEGKVYAVVGHNNGVNIVQSGANYRDAKIKIFANYGCIAPFSGEEDEPHFLPAKISAVFEKIGD